MVVSLCSKQMPNAFCEESFASAATACLWLGAPPQGTQSECHTSGSAREGTIAGQTPRRGIIWRLWMGGGQPHRGTSRWIRGSRDMPGLSCGHVHCGRLFCLFLINPVGRVKCEDATRLPSCGRLFCWYFMLCNLNCRLSRRDRHIEAYFILGVSRLCFLQLEA